MKWHIVSEELFSSIFNFSNYTHSLNEGYTDFYEVEIVKGITYHGKVTECKRTHKNMYFIKY